MMKFWEYLWSGCWHEWKPLSKHVLHGDGDAKGMRYMYICHKCNKVKRKDII